MNIRLLYISFSLVLALTLGSICARAQKPVATVGTNFTLAVPEGADGLVDPFGQGDSSRLFLLIISHSVGSATISSPSGYSKHFCYDSLSDTQIELPHSLMLYPGEGKSSKGLVVHSTSPIQLVLVDRFDAGGEVTQVYPDSALGTEYRIATWGIYNDPGEDNKTEFVITAPYDNTSVTIAPAVRPVGMADASAFTIQLNAGECYIVKADESAQPKISSLSGSLVTATKPVSVISGLTCGYAPLGAEACNELLNMQLPRSVTDTVFHVAPFGVFTGYALLFVSDTPNFFVIDGSGQTYTGTNGVATVGFTSDPQRLITTAPAQCYQLSSGYDLTRTGMSDPSMITVLPRSQWIDSVEWISPDLADPVFGYPFPNYISVIYPTSVASELRLDGVPALSLATPQPVPKSIYSNIIIQVPPGQHTFTSPQPIFAFASGFSVADAYSYNVGSVLPPASYNVADTISSLLIFDTIGEPSMCHDFDVAIRLQQIPTDKIEHFSATLTFDPLHFTYLGLDQKSVALANTFKSSTTNSSVTVDALGFPLAGTDTVCILHFHCSVEPGNSSMTMKSSFSKSEPFCQTADRLLTKTLSIRQVSDTEAAVFGLTIPSVIAGETTVGTLSLVVAPPDPISSIRLRISYNHNLMTLRMVDAASGATNGFAVTPITAFDDNTDEVTVSFSPQLSSSGDLVRLTFRSFVTTTDSGTVRVETDMTNDRPCPLAIVAMSASALFTVGDTCGTSVMRQYLQGISPTLSRIVPNPTTGKLQLIFDRELPRGPYSIEVMNILGEHVRRLRGSTIGTSTSIGPINLSDLPEGTYFLEIDLDGLKCAARVVIRN